MKNIHIYTNKIKDPDGSIYNRVYDYLIKKGVNVLNDPQDGAECIIVLGGDGTLISAARKYASQDYVFFGINLGTIGYLTDIEMDDLEKSLDAVVSDNYHVEERMMIRGNLERKDGSAETHIALNDIVINRSGRLCIIDYRISVNEKFLTLYRADGIIASTPTGSTGYSLSAGGPIIEPKSKLILITPICPQSLSARPMILSPDSSVMIEIDANERMCNASVELSFDGKANVDVYPGDKIIIKTSSKTTRIGRLKEESFVETMRQKLGN